MITRPLTIEYSPAFKIYIDLVSGDDLESVLVENTKNVLDFFTSIPFHKLDYAYSSSKWTIKQILMHLIDTERIFSYRALVCLRGDSFTPLFKIDEKLYVSTVSLKNRTLESLLEEFLIVRNQTFILLQNGTEDQLKFLGNGITHHYSARACGFIVVGHVLHHIQIIKRLYL